MKRFQNDWTDFHDVCTFHFAALLETITKAVKFTEKAYLFSSTTLYAFFYNLLHLSMMDGAFQPEIFILEF